MRYSLHPDAVKALKEAKAIGTPQSLKLALNDHFFTEKQASALVGLGLNDFQNHPAIKSHKIPYRLVEPSNLQSGKLYPQNLLDNKLLTITFKEAFDEIKSKMAPSSQKSERAEKERKTGKTIGLEPLKGINGFLLAGQIYEDPFFVMKNLGALDLKEHLEKHGIEVPYQEHQGRTLLTIPLTVNYGGKTMPLKEFIAKFPPKKKRLPDFEGKLKRFHDW